MFVGICIAPTGTIAVYLVRGDVPILSFMTFTSRNCMALRILPCPHGFSTADPHATSFRDLGLREKHHYPPLSVIAFSFFSSQNLCPHRS
ncbi:hypothetical protein AVEN_54590-1 [Araneus ventricosus]|uniref:Uncharacterized protein n=1 Tax=Araneus ventricosus TaxID=182803 RepID=A0A4Y2BMK7_ARAVE|nr:hypothetical protein AVEN_54590-1 [Araneus ventricosus]